MYYSITFSHNKPGRPLFFGMDNRTYFFDLGSTQARDSVKNTWNDWHLVPTKRPSIPPPEPKTKIVEVPGMMGDLDMTESLTGYPMYKNRSGSITFKVMNDYEHWHEIYADICSFLNGRVLYFALEDDPAYFYHGRVTVEEYDSQKDNSEITFNYEVDPAKYEYINGQVDGGFWDTFDFETDNVDGIKYTNKMYQFTVDSPTDFVKIARDEEWGNFTEFPVTPEIKVATDSLTGVEIHFINKELDIDVTKNLTGGTYIIPEIVFTQIKNKGKVYKAIAPADSEPPYAIKPSTYQTMGYSEPNSLLLEIRGSGTVTFNFNTGRT